MSILSDCFPVSLYKSFFFLLHHLLICLSIYEREQLILKLIHVCECIIFIFINKLHSFRFHSNHFFRFLVFLTTCESSLMLCKSCNDIKIFGEKKNLGGFFFKNFFEYLGYVSIHFLQHMV
jgi:hypothetical protein